MKPLYLLLFCCLYSFIARSQETKEPLFSLLSEIKNVGEFKYKNILKEQELAIDTLPDEPKDKKIKEHQRLNFYAENADCREAYYILKFRVDKLISQLKADLTMSNKKKLIEELNDGTADTNSWYYHAIKDVQEAKGELLKCNQPGYAGIAIADITGIFSAVVEVFKSVRDFRAQQIKSLCEQLDGLRLSDIDAGQAASGAAKKEDDKEKD